MTLLSFFGCGLIAFGPFISIFTCHIATQPERFLLLFTSAFFFIFSLLVASSIWYGWASTSSYWNNEDPPLPLVGIAISTLFQEVFRGIMFLMIRKARPMMVLVSKIPFSQYNLLEYAMISGCGFGLMNSLLSIINFLVESAGPGILLSYQCPAVTAYFVMSIQASLMSLLQVLWTLLSFEGWYRVYLWWHLRGAERKGRDPKRPGSSEVGKIDGRAGGEVEDENGEPTADLNSPASGKAVGPDYIEVDRGIKATRGETLSVEKQKQDTISPFWEFYTHSSHAYLTIPTGVTTLVSQLAHQGYSFSGSPAVPQASSMAQHEASKQWITSIGMTFPPSLFVAGLVLGVSWVSHFGAVYVTVLNGLVPLYGACGYSILALVVIAVLNLVLVYVLFFRVTATSQQKSQS